jgi:hypothetical protein
MTMRSPSCSLSPVPSLAVLIFSQNLFIPPPDLDGWICCEPLCREEFFSDSRKEAFIYSTYRQPQTPLSNLSHSARCFFNRLRKLVQNTKSAVFPLYYFAVYNLLNLDKNCAFAVNQPKIDIFLSYYSYSDRIIVISMYYTTAGES